MTQAIKVEGLKEFSRALRGMDRELPKELRKGLNDLAESVIEEARPLAPSRTGAFRRSMKARSTRTLARAAVGAARVPYGPWIEFGGRVGPRQSVVRTFKKRGYHLYPTYDRMKASGEIEAKLSDVLRAVGQKAGLEVD